MVTQSLAPHVDTHGIRIATRPFSSHDSLRPTVPEASIGVDADDLDGFRRPGPAPLEVGGMGGAGLDPRHAARAISARNGHGALFLGRECRSSAHGQPD